MFSSFTNSVLSVNKIKRVIAISLVLTALILESGCGNKKEGNASQVGSESVPFKESSSSQNDTLLDGSDEDAGEEYTTEVTLSTDVDVKIGRSDRNEISATVDSAYLSNPLKGYADDEAEEMRNKILNTDNTEKFYEITGTKYYISPDGDDVNDGKSPKTAWRTVDSLDFIVLRAGDAVLFERNSVFRITKPINATAGVTYGSYGKGTKPCIYASPKNYAEDGTWEPTKKKNVWKTDFAYDEAGGMIFNHGEKIGYYKSSGIDQLKENTQFYHNKSDGIVYLYCDKGNPSNVYKDIEIMPSYVIISIAGGVSNVTIDNFCLKYSALMGISAAGRNNNLNITNCEIGFIGGTTQNGSVRMGNAIQTWEGNTGLIVENNWIYQSFDTAISWQGFGGEKARYLDISFSDNLLEYNNADIEFFENPGSEISNFVVANNIMRFTSLGWGTRMDDAGIRGIEGCIRGDTAKMGIFKNVVVRDNIFDCPGKELVNWLISPEQLKQLTVSGSKVYVNGSYRTAFQTNAFILRGMSLTGLADNKLLANNQDELNYAFKLFDTSSTASAIWYN